MKSILNYLKAIVHTTSGVIWQAQGQFDKAAHCYQKALKATPRFAMAHYGLGNTLHWQGQLDTAIYHYQQAIHYRPDFYKSHQGLAQALKKQSRFDEAIASYQEVLRLRPNHIEAAIGIGDILNNQLKPQEARPYFEKVLKLAPDNAEAHLGMAGVFKTQGYLDDAMVHYHKALDLLPGNPEIHHGMANTLRGLGKTEEAFDYFKKALTLKPDYIEAWCSQGNAYFDLGNFEQAVACYEEALKVKPDYSDAHLYRGLTWLLHGYFKEGWPGYEWRFIQNNILQRYIAENEWDGSPLAGRRILVLAEQGFGDIINFVRYLPMVQARGGYVIFECYPQLQCLLEGYPGIDELVVRGDVYPPPVEHDTFIYLLSLPRLFETTLETIPPVTAPFRIPEPIREKWAGRLEADKNLKVGIVWTGNPDNTRNQYRSCTLNHFARFAHIPHVTFYSLQKGAGTEQTKNPPEGLNFVDLEAELNDFTDTVAAISQLDLVITIDTVVAHLAGTMNKPVWLLLAFVPDWRWQLNRSDTLWYPSMQLFRQPKPDDWESVFHQLLPALEALAGQRLMQSS